MTIKSFAEIQASTDKVCANLVGGNEKKIVSYQLEAGKALESIRLRHPSAKSLNEAYRMAGGIGKAPDLATQTRAVFCGLVLTGFYAESAYDVSVINMFKPVSPSLKLLEKHADKFAADGLADRFRAKIADILTAKPEDGVKQLKHIRVQIAEIAGVAKEDDALADFEEMLAKYLTGTEKAAALITDEDAELAFEIIRDHATRLVDRVAAIREAAESTALPADPAKLAA